MTAIVLFKSYVLSPIGLAGILGATIVTALVGPFGTIDYPIGYRVAYWGIVILLACILGWACRAVAVAWFGPASFWRRSGMCVMLHTASFSPLLWAVTSVMLSPRAEFTFVEYVLYVLIIDLVIQGFEYAYRLTHHTADADDAAEADTAQEPAPLPRLLTRLSEETRGELIRLSVNDHYVEVVTDQGSERLLMRFSDALAELDGAEGIQVHRSHWVAQGKIVSAERDGAAARLMLVDGSAVPVSRSRRPHVEAAGLL